MNELLQNRMNTNDSDEWMNTEWDEYKWLGWMNTEWDEYKFYWWMNTEWDEYKWLCASRLFEDTNLLWKVQDKIINFYNFFIV